jgi:hypothetical protein
MKSLSAEWRSWHERNIDPKEGLPSCMPSYREALADYDAGFSPDAYSSDRLSDAVFLGAADYDHALLGELLELAIAVGRRIETDAARWSGIWNTGHRALYRGNLSSTIALAAAWRDDATPTAERLRAAADDLAKNAIGIGFWGAPEQSQYLRASQLLLIAGDVDAAKELMNRRKRFDAVSRYHRWYMEWLTNGMSRDIFDSLFDIVRAPEWVSERNRRDGIQLEEVPGLLKLRLAVIRWTWVENQLIAGHWRDAIAQLAR